MIINRVMLQRTAAFAELRSMPSLQATVGNYCHSPFSPHSPTRLIKYIKPLEETSQSWCLDKIVFS